MGVLPFYSSAVLIYRPTTYLYVCLPVLLYGTEACPMKKSHIASLHFVVNSCFAKIFNTRSKVVIEESQFYFGFSPVSDHRKAVAKVPREIRRLGQYIVRSCLR